jgi:hypothetical protein
MKQVKCWVRWIDGRPCCAAEQAGRDDPKNWVEMTGEIPEADIEKTCEVRWCEESCEWEIRADEFHWVRRRVLARALQYAEERGWRVTNDPREVVLKEYDYGWQLLELRNGYWSFDSAQCPLQLSDWRERVRIRGWRILREEPAQHQHRMTLGEVLTRTDFSEPSDVETLFIRIVEAIGRDKR